MISSNLSKLTLSPYLFELLKEEAIHFDWIISDHHYPSCEQPLLLLNQPFGALALEYGIKHSDHILIILSELTSGLILPSLAEYSQVTIINTFDGISSLGKKSEPELDTISPLIKSGFELFFPFDTHYFLSALKQHGRNYLSIHNQEIAENIYTFPEDEALTVIDKALAEHPEMINLIHNPDADTLIIAMGNYFEELVKLSTLLLTQHENYHFTALAKWGSLHTSELINHAKKAKKLIGILDQLPSSSLLEQFSSTLGIAPEKLQFLTPNYTQLTSIQAEYQLEQAVFDAQHLFDQIKN